MPVPPFPESTLTLTSLQDPTTPALLDIRPFLGRLGRGTEYDILVQVQQAFDSLQETFRNAAPSLDQLTIASADIGDLTVGSQFGPGQLTVLNGPPSYSNIGWIGSQNSAVAVNITNIVAGLATTAAPHGLKVGDITLIAATTNVLHNGYFVVATTPLATTFTATGISGGSTGGTSTRQFQGGWLRTLAVGGTNFADANFIADVDGSLTITDALITLNGTGGTITLDPSVPSFVLDAPASILNVEISPSVGFKIKSTFAGSFLSTQVTGGDVVILNAAGHLNARLTSNGTIHDGRLSIYDNLGVETFSVLGQDGSVTFSFASAQGVDLDEGASPSVSQLTLRANALGALELLCYAADNEQILLDCAWTGAAMVAKSTSVARFVKAAGVLNLQGATGQVVGNPVADAVIMHVNLANGRIGFGGNVTPGYPVDATGDINASGVLRIAGTQVVGAQLALVGAPTINTTTATGAAGATYTATEQAMINQHVTAINQLNTDVTNLAATVNTLRSRLSTTGITA